MQVTNLAVYRVNSPHSRMFVELKVRPDGAGEVWGYHYNDYARKNAVKEYLRALPGYDQDWGDDPFYLFFGPGALSKKTASDLEKILSAKNEPKKRVAKKKAAAPKRKAKAR